MADVQEIRLVIRNQSRGRKLASQISAPIKLWPWEKRASALKGASMLVNATSLGMTGFPPLEIELSFLPPEAVVNDIVYVPLRTTLLKMAEARGNVIVDGLGMLIHQAKAGFASWFGIEPEVTLELKEFLISSLERN